MAIALFSLTIMVVTVLIIGRRSVWSALAGLLVGSLIWLYNYASLFR